MIGGHCYCEGEIVRAGFVGSQPASPELRALKALVSSSVKWG